MTKVKMQPVFKIFSAFAVRYGVLSLVVASVSWLDGNLHTIIRIIEVYLKAPQLHGCHHINNRNMMGGDAVWKGKSFLKHHKPSRDALFPNRSAQAIRRASCLKVTVNPAQPQPCPVPSSLCWLWACSED